MATAKGNVAIGIDLGTTNTCVAVCRNGKVETIPNKQGAYVTPSWVIYSDQEVVVGQTAKDTGYKNKCSVLFGIKRIIGRKYNDLVVQTFKTWKFNVLEDDLGNPKIEVVDKNTKVIKLLCPEAISGFILREMKEIAEAYLEETNIIDAVITVPAYFNDNQRQATIDAAKTAGLNVLRLINEPTAAAISYIFDKPEKSERNILVYDLGGGTFDVSIVSLEGSNVMVKATRGDTNLGGVNFDDRCVTHFLDLLKDKYNIDTAEANLMKLLHRLQNQVERAKHNLSSTHQTNIELDGFYNDIDVFEEFNRARFDDLNDDLYRETFKIMKQCIKEAKLRKEDIDDIVLVGGSTRVCKIEEDLEKYFGKPVSKALNRDQAVAQGAAILAAKLNSTLPQDLNILDVTAMSLGIETRNGEMNVLVKRNTQIPTQAQCTYTTAHDAEDAIKIIILEGDSPVAKNNLELGYFDLLDLPPDPSVDVTFYVDINGIVTVNATEISSGISKTINVALNKGRLDPKEITLLKNKGDVIKKGNKERDIINGKRNTFESYLLKLKKDLTRDIQNISSKKKDVMLNMVEEALSWLKTKDAYDVKNIDNKFNVIKKYCSNMQIQ